jgi:Fe-S cluster biogenesis protein NfuA
LCFKIKNKIGSMSSCKSVSATVSENVARRLYKSIRLEETTEVIRRMEGEQWHPTACRNLNMAPPL